LEDAALCDTAALSPAGHPVTGTDPALIAAVDASEADRLWFQAHPHRKHRVRPHIPGEWPHGYPERVPPPGWRWFTVIRQVQPGFRVRLALAFEGEPATDERAATCMFELVLDAAAVR
jgi:hypothetical protein